MARFILLVLASTILACEAKFKTGFAPCAGYENHPFQYVSGSMPDVHYFPGSSTVSFEVKSSIDLPSDAVIDIKIKKVAASPDDVHNIIGEGSDVYDLCKPSQHLKEICKNFPTWIQCGCPLKAGSFAIKNYKYQLPALGGLGAIASGQYESRALVYGKSDPDNVLGCFNMNFAVAVGQGHDEL